ncbi:hypothetical protein A33O_14370 [Nitratireductor aquibiodomus RA22]|uniref:Uncharacterized protein n=1 Tax=Nitratireductor aquibiodomus RA22 TaxID=1189611 RepID=I5BW20_9HYPH|nr:hypothetical protein A33O_14370 [Nitratireductor aquibiodomus RA22]
MEPVLRPLIIRVKAGLECFSLAGVIGRGGSAGLGYNGLHARDYSPFALIGFFEVRCAKGLLETGSTKDALKVARNEDHHSPLLAVPL